MYHLLNQAYKIERSYPRFVRGFPYLTKVTLASVTANERKLLKFDLLWWRPTQASTHIVYKLQDRVRLGLYIYHLSSVKLHTHQGEAEVYTLANTEVNKLVCVFCMLEMIKPSYYVVG